MNRIHKYNIGDIVESSLLPSGFGRVYEVRSDSVIVIDADTNLLILCSNVDIQQILLSEQILNDNGFECIDIDDGIITDFPSGLYQNDNLYCGWDNRKGLGVFYTFSDCPNEDGCINEISNIKTVDELQRALRISDLYDAALHFKVNEI